MRPRPHEAMMSVLHAVAVSAQFEMGPSDARRPFAQAYIFNMVTCVDEDGGVADWLQKKGEQPVREVTYSQVSLAGLYGLRSFGPEYEENKVLPPCYGTELGALADVAVVCIDALARNVVCQEN